MKYAVPLLAAGGTLAVSLIATTGTASGFASAPAHERPAVLALPLPAGASGGDLIGEHGGPWYVGASQYPDQTQHPTIWRRHGFDRFTPVDVGLVTGMNYGWASGADDRGQVSVNESGDAETAFVWAHGRLHQLSDLSGGTHEQTFGIEPNGHPFGYVGDPSGAIVPVVWPAWNQPPEELALPAGFTQGVALGANPCGALTGIIGNADFSVAQPVVWRPNGTVRVLRPAPPVDGFGQAWGLSSAGVAVGEEIWQDGQQPQATVWRPGHTGVDLGALPGDVRSRLFGTSPNGQAAGVSYAPGVGVPRVIYWPGHGPLETLRPYGRASNSTAAHVVDNAGNVQGTTVVGYHTSKQRDIPTLWTDAPDQAFVPPASAQAHGRALSNHALDVAPWLLRSALGRALLPVVNRATRPSR